MPKTNVEELLNRKEFFLLNKERKRKKKDYSHSGVLEILSAEVIGGKDDLLPKRKISSLVKPLIKVNETGESKIGHTFACINFNGLEVKMSQAENTSSFV